MSQPPSMFQPLPGRECGECQACCVELAIDDPKLKKADEVPCTHMLGGGGCAIYAERPHTCATWFCGWRLVNVGDELRPDRSKVLMIPEFCEAPGYQKGGLKLAPIGSDLTVLLQDKVVDFTGLCVARGIPIFLTYGAGRHAKRILVNDLFKPAVMAGDRARFVKLMADTLDRMAAEVRNSMASA